MTVNLYTYVVRHDFAFAPNPFFGFCTLATCKPDIRRTAPVGSFIVGTGCAARKRRGQLVYYMKVSESLTFDAYWSDVRFYMKRPFLRGNRMRAFGDNIYHRNPVGDAWLQESSYHSLHSGKANPVNVKTDTRTNRVLVGTEFAYWGGSGPRIPEQFRDYEGDDVCATRGHRVNFSEGLAVDFISWIHSLKCHGVVGRPFEWAKLP